MRKDQIYNYILHLLAGIAIGFLLFSCKAPKPSCEAYSYVEGYKYCIEGRKVVENDTIDVVAFTNSYSMACDSIYYYNSDSSIQSLLEPYNVYEN
jgi:hypothetical protein